MSANLDELERLLAATTQGEWYVPIRIAELRALRKVAEAAAWCVEVASLWNWFHGDALNPFLNPAMRYSLDREAECARVGLESALSELDALGVK